MKETFCECAAITYSKLLEEFLSSGIILIEYGNQGIGDGILIVCTLRMLILLSAVRFWVRASKSFTICL